MATVELLTISDAARAIGVSAHTLRYYERAGLMLDRVERNAATHRRYTDDDLRWVILLTRLRGDRDADPARCASTPSWSATATATRASGSRCWSRTAPRCSSSSTRSSGSLAAIDAKIDLYRELIA